MLVIDENMFRLAKMQETLLKVSSHNREENLNKYKELVVKIDDKAFDDILNEIKYIDKHNQTLEEEVEYLQKIKDTYLQLFELQSSFRRVCEKYGNSELELSDLSILNIEYIENRLNTINGYLINLKNIEINKKRIQELNEQLIIEEKNKSYLSSKLLEMEKTLKNNFINAEGRLLIDGKLEYTSVVSEYKNLGFDFDGLLNDRELFKSKLLELESKKNEVSDSVKAAEICYNSMLNEESKQILNDITQELLMLDYKITLLKLLELFSFEYVEYHEVVQKREQLKDLINYRVSCMEKMGIKFSIDPFDRIKVNEQYETILALIDNSNVISKIRKEVSELNSRTEAMLSQNNGYLISLNDTKKLIEDRMSLSDIDINYIDLSLDKNNMEREIAGNQVMGVKTVPITLNMGIVDQKTASVIKRVNKMMNTSSSKSKEEKETLIPELVIVPSANETSNIEEPVFESIPQFDTDDEIDNLSFENNDELKDVNPKEETESKESTYMKPISITDVTDIFETVTPFEEPSLFVDKTDDVSTKTLIDEKVGDALTLDELKNIGTKENNVVEFKLGNFDDQMPDAFWVTQDNTEANLEEDEEPLSFDDQIEALISSENDGKVRKKVA